MLQLRAGSVFAKAYEIVRQISAGGMGVVYEVIHLGTRRRRALKIMLPHIVSDPKMRERFTLEAVVTADIESEHLTEVFDAGIDPETDCPYLVMELLRGEDLGARLKRGERTSGEDTLVLMDQVAHALERTHARGVVHRDLKPDNLFVAQRDDGSPRIKILDFGIAKLVRADVSGAQATTKTFGTPYYMAREQITGESALIGPASDLYAVAHIVFALLTGRPYFEDEARKSDGNVLSLLMTVGHGATESALKRALRRGVQLPPAFDAWFSQATALAPVDRFSSARTMIAALREVLREPVVFLGAEAGPASGVEEGVSATSSRLEQSFPTPGPSSSGDPASGSALHQTGGPQSITTQTPAIAPKKPARGLLVAGGVALVAGVVAVTGWSLAARETPAAAASSSPTATSLSAATQTATSSNEGREITPSPPLVAPGNAASVTASAPSSASVAAEPSAPVAASAATGAARGAPPRPVRTGPAPAGPELWETR